MLVDGGVTDNIPADVARLLGADYVIGVDIFTPALRRRLGPLGQGLAAIETLVRHAGKGSNECDCLIVPQMSGRSYFKFTDYQQLIALGEEAARRALPNILNSLGRMKATVSENGHVLELASIAN
jgi:NTE family protein